MSILFDFNPYGEAQLIATDGASLALFPRQQTHKLKRNIARMYSAGLTFVAVLFSNFSPSYVYQYRDLLENHWLGIELEMQRRPSTEYQHKLDALLIPARNPLKNVEGHWQLAVETLWLNPGGPQ